MPMKHVPAYIPTLYLPGSRGRYRTYPRQVFTPIPGAGFHADSLVWGEQVLDLSGRGPGRRGDLTIDGNYVSVPLRGLGTTTARGVPSVLSRTPSCMRTGTTMPPDSCWSCPPGYDKVSTGVPGMPPMCAPSGASIRPQVDEGARQLPSDVPPPSGGNPKFFDVGKAIFSSNPVPAITAMGPAGQDALVSYAKITAVGTFIIAPLMGVAGYLIGKNSKKMQANRRRRSRR